MTDEVSEGTEITTEDDTTVTDGVAQNNATNNPENNKKIAEITMMESIRDKYKLTFNMPDVFKGLHTNKFMYMELSDQFYEKHYADIIEAIKDKKFTRYAGFEKGRFFVEKYVWGGGIGGKHSKITVNPLANNYSAYMKAQQEAEKALISAMNNGNTSGGGGLTNVNGDDCGADISTWAPHSWGPSSFEKGAQKILGNSSANYATKTANMSAEQAIKSIKHHWADYSNNRHCPQKLFEKYPNGTIYANCADLARLVKCICDVHGVKCTIHHGSSHYWNYVYINNKWESVDLCTPNNNRWDGKLRNTAGWQGGWV